MPGVGPGSLHDALLGWRSMLKTTREVLDEHPQTLDYALLTEQGVITSRELAVFVSASSRRRHPRQAWQMPWFCDTCLARLATPASRDDRDAIRAGRKALLCPDCADKGYHLNDLWRAFSRYPNQEM